MEASVCEFGVIEFFIFNLVNQVEGFRRRGKAPAALLNRPRLFASGSLPKQPGRILRAALGDQGIVEHLFELDAAFRFAGWITGLPWPPFGGFVAGKASFEFFVPIIQGFSRGADSWP